MQEEKEELKLIQVHVSFLSELNLLKEELEKKTGYPIRGGNSIVSKLLAKLLRQRREMLKEKNINVSSKGVDFGKDNIKFECRKIKGVKKNELVFL